VNRRTAFSTNSVPKTATSLESLTTNPPARVDLAKLPSILQSSDEYQFSQDCELTYSQFTKTISNRFLIFGHHFLILAAPLYVFGMKPATTILDAVKYGRGHLMLFQMSNTTTRGLFFFFPALHALQ
jgi:hypothetical protein